MRAQYVVLAVITLLIASSASANPAAQGPRSATCDLSGEWLGSGLDEGGTSWSFPFHARQTGTALVATIEWSGSDGHTGRERVRGVVDCAARRLEMVTESLEGPELAPGRYHATFTADGRAIDGTWDGTNVVRGRFSLRRR